MLCAEQEEQIYTVQTVLSVFVCSVNGMLKESTLGGGSPRVRLSYEIFTTSPISWLTAINLFRSTSARTKQMHCSGSLLTWTLVRSGKTSWKPKFRYLATVLVMAPGGYMACQSVVAFVLRINRRL